MKPSKHDAAIKRGTIGNSLFRFDNTARASERANERERERKREEEEKRKRKRQKGCYAGGERTGLKPHQKRDGYIITLAYTIGWK